MSVVRRAGRKLCVGQLPFMALLRTFSAPGILHAAAYQPEPRRGPAQQSTWITRASCEALILGVGRGYDSLRTAQYTHITEVVRRKRFSIQSSAIMPHLEHTGQIFWIFCALRFAISVRCSRMTFGTRFSHTAQRASVRRTFPDFRHIGVSADTESNLCACL